MAYDPTKGYDPVFDYSAALAGSLSDAERTRLLGERSAKISDMYGGKEPTLAGSSQTFSQTYGADGTRAATPDYSALLSDAMRAGADSATVQRLLDARVQKALGDPSLTKYAFDGVYGNALKYIEGAQQKEGMQNALEEYRNLYSGQNGALARALEQQQAANDAAVQRTINSLSAQKDDTDRRYGDYFRQAYVDRMKAQKGINQRMAAQGVTGGAAESTLLGLNTAYSDALRQGEQARISAIGDLDRAITDARLTGDITNAQAAADAIRNQTDSYAGVLANLVSRYDTLGARQTAYEREDAQRAEDFAREDALRQEVYEREDAAANRAWAQKLALQALQNGNMPDDATLAAAGMSRTEAATLLALPKVTGGGSGKVAAASTQEDAIISAIAALSGEKVSNIRALWEAGYDFSDYADSIPALRAYLGGGSGAVAAQSGYDEVMRDIQTLRLSGASDTQVNNVVSNALASGAINGTEASSLRRTFIGAR